MTLDEQKEALGKAERALMDAKGTLDTALAANAELAKRAGAPALTPEQIAELPAVKALGDNYKKLSDEVVQIMTSLQDPSKGLPGSHPDDKKGQETARRAHTKWVRNARIENATNEDLVRGLNAEEREHCYTMQEAREKRSLYVSSDELGGFLVNPVTSGRIIDQVVQVSPIRALAQVMSISGGGVLRMNRENGQITAGWTAERGTRSETTGNLWKAVEIPTHEQYALLRPSWQLLDDVAFNLEAWLEGRAGRQFARGEGIAFTTGNGVTRPQGIVSHPDVVVLTADATATQGQVIPNDIIDAMGNLITEYANSPSARVLATRATMTAWRKFRDNQNRPLDVVVRDVLSKLPSFLVDGYQGVEVPDMASWGTASAKLMVFGDIKEAYTIVDRQMMNVIRDPFSRKLEGEVELMYKRRVGGQVVQPDALRILQAAA